MRVVQRILKRYSYSKLMIWRGKEFWIDISGHPKGESILFRFDNPTRFGRFDIRIDKYNKGSAIFDYDIDDNNLILRRVRDEVRKVNDNLFIGKLYLLLGNKEIFLNYFAMERESRIEKSTPIPSPEIKKPRARKN